MPSWVLHDLRQRRFERQNSGITALPSMPGRRAAFA